MKRRPRRISSRMASKVKKRQTNSRIKGKDKTVESDADEVSTECLDHDVDLSEPDVLAHEETNRRRLGRTASQRNNRQGKRNKRNKRSGDPKLFWEVWQQENENWLNAHENDDFDLEGADELILPETAEASSDLVLPLLRFQKEWLAWALKQENSEVKGGILADEMGMGKTIQAISLVITSRSIRSECGESLCTSSSSLPKIKSTLVICPVVAVTQWMSEIARFTKEGSVKALVYHGAQRGKGGYEQFSEYDFVLTTYSTVEADYRKCMMPPKERCIWCGKLFKPEKIGTHLRYYCGPDAVKTEKQSKQVRKRGLRFFKHSNMENDSQTIDESDDDCSPRKGSLGKWKEKGKHKTQGKPKKDKEADSSNYSVGINQGSSGQRTILHSVTWERIILDEAHFIKDRRSNTARAVFTLESSYKWALSGTPLQNRVGELYSLIRFLQLLPYSYYFCKDCECKKLDYSTSSQCQQCEHKAMRHFCWWNRHIAVPIQKYGYVGEGRRAMILLRQKLMQSVVLRRTKKGRAADLALPPRIVSVRRDSFDNQEEDFYEALYTQSQAQFNAYIDTGTLLNNYAHIFDLLTRLRQAVDHPYLVIFSKTANMNTAESNVPQAQDCGICHEEAEDPVVTACEHCFCKACLMEYSSVLGQVACPSCSKPLTVDFTAKKSTEQGALTVKGFKRSSILNKICLEDFQTSTKIEALREEIRFMVESDGSAKGIVFSQFTSFLDLINYSLQKSGVKCVQLVGSMTMAARDEAIKRFTDDPDCKIFLMSLKAGGVALNLTVASNVFLMDPWWNPAVEQQAQDRIHRIGQYKPIRTVRFVIENTIEERILRLQEKKQLVFEGTVGGSTEALGKLTEADLRFLFQM
ncbi:DNA repair protein RAD16 isoform X2 [Aristolochia californica]|uniref:DNA repair protein RAD16 isoform X2 n=1 Tax=Aristolochia californica TaxID=171875 RepID=UPI0035DDD017